MQPLFLVKAQVIPQAFASFMGTDVILDEDLLIFNGMSQHFCKNVVERPTFAIYTDAHVM